MSASVKMSLERARTAEPAPLDAAGPADIATWQARLRAVVLDTVTESEVREILKAVMAKAKGGDIAAARMILAYAVGNPPKGDEGGEGPSRAKPGTSRKLEVLAYRHTNGRAMHHPGDAKFGADDQGD